MDFVHEAALDDERYDTPEAPGVDVALRSLSLIRDHERTLELPGPHIDGLYEYHHRAVQPGRAPS
ncbi:hypothetical protein AV521_32420 [Streptomyces sp. IMTB 2501]|uniref:hypothetical protein n=1 Tax=Streptomyces sp. IMTB 2501 TaxID=1776340 RepID=UPI00096F1BF7|nr:hypothetical protein [Streptomyces sp. IMTB 2501]OLZ65382.1 hypothetical protein AV521_32420 [Streptomyces sp. IMTB 2501]